MNRDISTSSFPVYTPFICFSCIISLAGDSRTTLSKSDESRYPCLVLGLRKAFRLSLLYLLIFILKIVVRDFPGGAVVKNPLANAEDTGSSPGPGRSHMPRSN